MNEIVSLTPALRGEFLTACGQEHVYGSKIATSLQAFGLCVPQQEFFLARRGADRAGLFLSGSVLLIASEESFFSDALPAWIGAHSAKEVCCRLPLCEKLQKQLGGSMESSYFMEYNHASPPQAEGCGIFPTSDLPTVFSVLQQSHDYYRTHLQFESWAAELTKKLDLGLAELVMLVEDGKPVATGSIGSQGSEAAVVAAIAVVPEARHKGLGREISVYLTRRILEKKKKPVLISGYDEVAELYRQIGYTECGRWGGLRL